ncbi:helix-turn-helix domain-containing protein [Bradyrhizobium tropiciagri]|uniref:IclR family transcriptional regulator n=1 Tax=Bradyrhizobium tropiciagri TaxID=312253 RepID=UPI001BA5581B|nr:helix-turn-helix domain-containing protein [Bradyrhizobium tropiciagri]MBR0899054.1 helix-turn-helix domain-containing protein [Bradyrhizobium tropiciagri]
MERVAERLALPSPAGTIEVVSRSFELLRCFNGLSVRLSNGDLSVRCGLPRSTVSRLTQTLTRMGLLVHLPAEQKYAIGPSAVCMSLAMTRSPARDEKVRAILSSVASRVPCVIALGIPDRCEITLVEAAAAEELRDFRIRAGNRVPISRTAAGHAYAAALGPAEADRLLQQVGRNAAREADRLQAGLEQNRRALKELGYIVTSGQFRAYLNSVAVPFWSSLYNSSLVLSISVFASDYDRSRVRNELTPLVIDTSAKIGRLLDPVLAPSSSVRSAKSCQDLSGDAR